MLDDNAVDRLTGSHAGDWFLANTLQDNSTVLDIITGLCLKTGETASDLDLNLL